MTNKEACFSHKSDDWSTPREIYDYFVKDREYFDPCPLFSEVDGLKIPWKRLNFVNPPYSDISSWVDKALKEAQENDRFTILLIPSRTDTKYFRKLLAYGCNFYFITGRLKFGDSKNGAPFPSVLISICPHSCKGRNTSVCNYIEPSFFIKN